MIRYEVAESKYGPDQWCVEGIDYDHEGVIYGTVFYGPDAAARAQEYATWKNKDDQEKG